VTRTPRRPRARRPHTTTTPSGGGLPDLPTLLAIDAGEVEWNGQQTTPPDLEALDAAQRIRRAFERAEAAAEHGKTEG